MRPADGATAYLGLGSNVGDREGHLRDAISRIAALDTCRLLRVSPVYETEPREYADQDDFLNCVCEINTALASRTLLNTVKNIEREMGRTPSEPSRPRIIDIDILLLGNTAISEEGLVIPHPQLARRRFVLVPLCELAPELRHPVLGGTINDLLAVCPDMGRVRRTDINLGTPQS